MKTSGFSSSMRHGTMATMVDERRYIMAIIIDLDGYLAGEVSQVAREIAQQRDKAPKSLQDFLVLHGENKIQPYNDEIMVIVKINDQRDMMNFSKFVQLVSETLRGSFETIEFPKNDPERNPYNLFADRSRRGWIEVS